MKFFNFTVLITLIISTPIYAQSFSSVYTSLTGCKLIESSSEGTGYLLKECEGREDYRIFIEGADARTWLAIKKGDQAMVSLQQEVMNNSPGFFPDVSGKVAEWRYNRNVPIALIFRIAAEQEIFTNEHSPPDYKVKSLLLVIRLKKDQVCLIGTTTSNVRARKIAESKKTCH